MIGRMELVEILGMVGTCTALLFAGLAVETLNGEVGGAWAVSDADIEEPSLPDTWNLADDIRIETPDIERPVELVPPPAVRATPPSGGHACEAVLTES